DCKFCAFYRRPKHPEGYLLSYEEIGRKIDELKSIGGVQILMQGGHNPYIPFEWYLDLLRYIKRQHPIHIHGFSPSEVDFFAGRCRPRIPSCRISPKPTRSPISRRRRSRGSCSRTSPTSRLRGSRWG